MHVKALFTTGDVERVCGLSYRQIQYWDSSGFIQPSVRKGGRYRLYTFRDLLFLKLAKSLRDRKVSVQRMRRILASLDALLEKVHKPLSGLTFYIEGDGILIFDGDLIMDSTRRSGGFLYRVRDLRDEVNGLLADADVLARERAS